MSTVTIKIRLDPLRRIAHILIELHACLIDRVQRKK